MSKSDVYAICMESPTAWHLRDELMKAMGLDEMPKVDDMTPITPTQTNEIRFAATC